MLPCRLPEYGQGPLAGWSGSNALFPVLLPEVQEKMRGISKAALGSSTMRTTDRGAARCRHRHCFALVGCTGISQPCLPHASSAWRSHVTGARCLDLVRARHVGRSHSASSAPSSWQEIDRIFSHPLQKILHNFLDTLFIQRRRIYLTPLRDSLGLRLLLQTHPDAKPDAISVRQRDGFCLQLLSADTSRCPPCFWL